MLAPQAAHYVGVSVTTLRKLPILCKELGGKRAHDKMALDAFADSLPYDGVQEVGWTRQRQTRPSIEGAIMI